MADIELVIKLPEEAYKLLQTDGVDWLGAEHILNAVANGTPLPKHYGRLIDADALEKKMLSYHDDCAQTSEYTRLGFETAMELVKDADTIIPTMQEKNSEKVIGTDVCSLTDKICIGKDCRACDINKQTATKEKGCKTCIHQDDDPMNGECYECVKGIMNHYEPATKEGVK